MKESQYIIATNRVKVSAALTILRDVLADGKDDIKTYGVSKDEVQNVCRELRVLEDRLFSMIEVQGGE